MGLFGKKKEEIIQDNLRPPQVPQAQQPPPQPTTPPQLPPPQTQQSPEGEEVIEGVEGEEGEGDIPDLFLEWDAALSEVEDDDLSIMEGRILEERMNRTLEMTESFGAIVRRIRRLEGLVQHLVAGGKHKVFVTTDQHIACECGGLKIPVIIPEEDRFYWDEHKHVPPQEGQAGQQTAQDKELPKEVQQ